MNANPGRKTFKGERRRPNGTNVVLFRCLLACLAGMKIYYHKLKNQMTWWSYQRQVRTRLRVWDSLGGGIHAGKMIQDSMLLSRPAFNPIPPDDPIFRDPRVGDSQMDTSWFHNLDYVCHLRQPAYIEPDFGYVIAEPDYLIPESLPWSHQVRLPQRLKYFSGVPSRADYQQAKQGKRPVQHEPIVISLRHVFDINYGHTLMQILPVLMLLDECGVPPEIPIVVSRRLGNQPFFQELISRGRLRDRRWIVQEHTYIHAQEILFGGTEWASPRMLDGLRDAIDTPLPDRQSHRRFFIQRRSTRQLQNEDALMPVLTEFGFEGIRPEQYSFGEQMTLFSGAEVVCGTLGAALTNAIFRRDAPMQILEIDPLPIKLDLFFYKLAKTCGYRYDFLTTPQAADRKDHDDYSLTPDHLHRFLQSALPSP